MRPQMRERRIFIFLPYSSSSSPSTATHMKREHSFCIYIHIHIQASTSFFFYSDPADDFDCSTRSFLDFCIEIPIRVCCAQQGFGCVCSIYPLDCPLFFLDLFHLPFLHHLLDVVLFIPEFMQCVSKSQIEYVVPSKVLAASTKRCWSMGGFRFPRVIAVFI